MSSTTKTKKKLNEFSPDFAEMTTKCATFFSFFFKFLFSKIFIQVFFGRKVKLSMLHGRKVSDFHKITLLPISVRAMACAKLIIFNQLTHS